VIAAEPAAVPARRRSHAWHLRLGRGASPYALAAPALVVIGAVLAYPLYFLVKLSFQRYGLEELIAHRGHWIGVDNYTQIFRRLGVLARRRPDGRVHGRERVADDDPRNARSRSSSPVSPGRSGYS
jgi:ABC-type sugar transport system permease subunit